MKKQRSLRLDLLIYGLFGIFYLWLAAQIPYTHDDWDWGLPVGIQQLVSANINSRYVGNFFEVVMTRSPLLKMLIMGGTLFAIPFLGTLLVTKDAPARLKAYRPALFLAANLLLLTIERRIWRQAVAWVAGFANFVLSGLFVMVYLYAAADLFSQEPRKKKASPYSCAALFLMCTAMQMFIENLAVFLVVLSVFLCVYDRICRKQWNGKYLAMLAGNLLGLVLMFSSSLYGTLFSTGKAIDGYRELTLSAHNGLFKSVYIFIRQVGVYLMPRLWLDNTVLSLVILGVLSLLVLRSDKPLLRKWRKLFVPVSGLLAIYVLVNHYLDVEPNPDAIASTLIRLVTNGVFFLLVTAQVLLLYWENKPLLGKTLLMWVCAIGVIAPLALTTETGYRLFYSSDLFLCLFVLYLLTDLWSTLPGRTVMRLTGAMIFCVVLVTGFYSNIYGAVGQVTRVREEIISQALQTGADSIVLPAYPYEEYLYWSNPIDESRWVFFKDFFGIPQDVEVTMK